MKNKTVTMSELCLTVSPHIVDQIRKILEPLKLNDSSRRLKHLREENLVAIPVTDLVKDLDDFKNLLTTSQVDINDKDLENVDIRTMTLPCAKRANIKTPKKLLQDKLAECLQKEGYTWTEEVNMDIPSHWERHGDLALLPDTAFTLPMWSDLGIQVWEITAECLSCSRLAQKSRITVDGYRTPQVHMLYGQDSWVEHVDNGIRYTYDITRCMFSAGNVTEKLRVANFQCEDEIVVDLYAGIGYFSLPYLVYTGVKHLHACEWNPDAVEALKRNLALNGVMNKCTVHYGDNRKVCPVGVADRVNLGLIPSSRDGWPVACAALKPSKGGILHIHYNVNTKPQQGNQCDSDICREPEEIFRCEAKCQKIPNDTQGIHIEDCTHGDKLECCGIEFKHRQNDFSRVKCLREENQQSKVCSYANSEETHSVKDQDNIEQASHSLSNNDANPSDKPSNIDSKCLKWLPWASGVANEIKRILENKHRSSWTTEILHIEHVKSYAPYVDHVVLDLRCKPVINTTSTSA